MNNDLIKTKEDVRRSFVYPTILEKHREYGGSFLLNPIINPTGDWRKALTPEEEQRRNGVDPSTCFIEAQQHSIATIEEYSLNEPDNNYASRFNALLADGSENGGDPIKGADSIRHDGLVKEDSMPQNVDSWDEFHSWYGVNKEKVIKEGQDDLASKDRRFGVFIEKNMSVETKYNLLKQAILRSPISMSVYGAVDISGNYIPKPEGVSDTHMVEAVYIDDNNCIYIRDTYKPFDKVLPPNYNPDFACGWTVNKKYLSTSHKRNLWSIILSWFNF